MRKASSELARLAEAEAPDMEIAGQGLDLLISTAKTIEKRAMEGMRVRVKDGLGKTELGFGTLVDHVTVYAKRSSEGGLVSLRFAEEPFEGAQALADNPKFEMDDGSVRYGCQVWWEPVTQ